jgi:hypothetical protein
MSPYPYYFHQGEHSCYVILLNKDLYYVAFRRRFLVIMFLIFSSMHRKFNVEIASFFWHILYKATIGLRTVNWCECRQVIEEYSS